MKISKLLTCLLCVLILVSGCGKKKEEASPTQPREEATTATVDSATAATVSGKVLFSGEVPPRKELPVKGNPECSVLTHGTILSEDLLAKDGKLQNVFVYVKEGLEKYTFPPPAEPVEIDNNNCVYVPHVSGAQANQPIRLINNDPTLHNMHAFPKNQPGWNIGFPFQGMKQTKKFTISEVMIPLKCDVHPWMLGYVGILPHPYFAVSAEDGSFSIKNLPPGKYVLEAWHESLGTKTISVTVGPKEVKEVEFEFRR